MKNIGTGIKTIEIHAQTRYPIVSAYEFEFLKDDPDIQDLIKPCTIYFIIQRPLLYLHNIYVNEGTITFEIRDDTASKPLQCTFEPSPETYGLPNEPWKIEFQFYKRIADTKAPFNNVAVFKLVSPDGKVLDWFSPTKFLYDVFFTDRTDMEVCGDHRLFRDYHVHYIGQAFKNDVWKRLTGHEKMQSILTNEDALNTQSLRAPFEISILLLDVDGYTEAAITPPSAIAIRPGHTPIIHQFSLTEDDETFEKFTNMTLATRAQELTNEVEAMLIKQFDPQYNKLKYRNYPNIKNGTRSAGYTQSELMIERMPALLKSRKHRMQPIGGSKT